MKKQNQHQLASDITRSKILDSARALFVRQGFSGTSIGALAKAAGINQSLIYHYFENKEELWRYVKQDMISKLIKDDSISAAPEINTVEELITHLIDLRYELYSSNPDLMRMLMWQALEEEDVSIKGTSPKWLTSWTEAVSELQRKKVIHNRLTAKEIIILLNGIIWGPFLTGEQSQDIANDYIKKISRELKNLLIK